ncbi:MAG: cysteine protease [Chlorobium phaeobacteroides]|nr:cysteine protease [Chlorobium phaeobacteroides]
MFPMRSFLELKGSNRPVGTGWLPPLPDLRDYNAETPEIIELASKLGIPQTAKTLKSALPAQVDLRQWCSPIENQGLLGSCTAQSAVGVIEYFQCRAFGKYIDASALFLYKATRNLMGVTGDTGAWLRNTVGAVALCGVPPEKYWKYTDQDPDFDNEPGGFIYAVADNFEALKYFCHDPLGAKKPANLVLQSVKKYLAAGIPSMCGFYGFNSFEQSDNKGAIPYPCPDEHASWGHAIMVVGYDDEKKVVNTACGKATTGALRIRNSWGTGWGEEGYGWLPYEYVLNGLALDFWSIINMEWVDTRQFGY